MAELIMFLWFSDHRIQKLDCTQGLNNMVYRKHFFKLNLPKIQMKIDYARSSSDIDCKLEKTVRITLWSFWHETWTRLHWVWNSGVEHEYSKLMIISSSCKQMTNFQKCMMSTIIVDFQSKLKPKMHMFMNVKLKITIPFTISVTWSRTVHHASASRNAVWLATCVPSNERPSMSGPIVRDQTILWMD